MTTKISLNNLQPSVVTAISAGGSGSAPKISSITYPGDDTAASTAGGQTITLTGSGFTTGASVIVNGSYAGVVTVVSNTSITFTAPANSGGTYPLYVVNTDGGTAISIPGISYSGTPSWSNTAGSLATVYETAALSTQLTATGNLGDGAITYSVYSGTLPPGSSLNTSTGLLSGTTQATASSTTYTFTIRASDAQNQDTDRAFSITINPDVVTWSSPADGTVTALFQDTAMSNVTLSATSAAGQSIAYSANALPTGVTISGSNVTGTPTVVGNTISVITATAANTNRTATRTFTWVVSVASDPYFKNTTLLLNGETTVTPFISDASTNSFALTINGDTKPVLFNPYQEGYYSNYFDGSGDYLTSPSSSLVAPTGDFTIECWFYANTLTSSNSNSVGLVFIGDSSSNDGRLQIAVTTTGAAYFYLRNNSAADVMTIVSNTGLIAVNNWYHIACVRSGNIYTIYLNGTSVGSTTSSTTMTYAANICNIGFFRASNLLQHWNGYISNFRLLVGTALYTSNFTPSTTPLTAIANTSLLTCQSNRIIDNSTNAYSITRNGDVSVSPNIPFTQNSSYSTYGSAYFDGTGDYLTIPNNSAFNFGTGDVTIECWFLMTADPAQDPDTNRNAALFNSFIASGSLASATTYGGGIDGNSSSGGTGLSFAARVNGTNQVVSYTGTVTKNVWHHYAFTRTGTTANLYLDGIRVAQNTNFTNAINTNGQILKLGGLVYAVGYNQFFPGYISNARILKGTAAYTGASFTPSTTPLTAIANTSLLTLQYNGGATNKGIIDNSNFNNIITRSGNTSQGTFSPYSVTGWSNYFDGTDDFLSYSSNSTLNFGTGDFTVEAWINLANTSSTKVIVTGTAATSFGLRFGTSYLGSSGLSIFKSATSDHENCSFAFLENTWYHVAVVRQSNVIKFFINGIQQTTAGSGGSNFTWPNETTVRIGTGDSGLEDFFGHISNLRIIKGTAVYTSTFTPSTTPLTAIANTSLLTCQSNRFIDNSPNSFTLTRTGDVSVQALDPFGSVPEAVPISYSNYFDGTGDGLTMSSNTALDILNGSYTIECWFNASALSGTHAIVSKYIDDFAPSIGYYISVSSTTITVFLSGSTARSYSFSTNVWYHLAVSVINNVGTVYVNGEAVGATFNAGVDNATNKSLAIGFRNGFSPGLYFNGHISNLRIMKGTGIYTSNFTPSTTPLTAIENTSLLTCQSTRMIDNSTNAFTLTAAGDVKPRIFNPFGYTAQTYTSYTPSLHGGSAYFDGTGDYLQIPKTPALYLGAGNFTIESWVYMSSLPATNTNAAIVGQWNVSDLQYLVYLRNNAGTMQLIFGYSTDGVTGVSTKAYTATGFTIGTWNHIAVSRSGSNFYMYVNGTIINPADTFSLTLFDAVGTLAIGRSGDNANYLTGYISDVRVVKGTAIYTSNFVPPTQTLTNYSTTYPSSLLLNFNNAGIIDQHGSNVIETLGNAQLSTAVKKYNNSSLYFDGTGDYLYGAPNINYAMGSGDFTIEFWYYPVSQNPAWNPNIMGNYNATWTTNKWALHAPHSVAAGKYSFWVNNYVNNAPILASTSNITNGAWVHLAITRSGSTWRMFVNGTIEATTTSSVALDGGTAASMDGFYVGANFYSGEGGRYINAYIDDLRITKGYARYTANFTAPTAALTTK
jgi:hypothetical protein